MSHTRTGRVITVPYYSSGSEEDANWKLRKANLDTTFLLVFDDETFTCRVESKVWPLGFTLDQKLGLVAGSTVRVFLKDDEVDAKFMKGAPD